MNVPVDVICKIYKDGNVTPVKMQYSDETMDKAITVNLHDTLFLELNRFAGNKMYVFSTQAEYNGIPKPIKLPYELDTCIWYLVKK